jgi:hypothetical protein
MMPPARWILRAAWLGCLGLALAAQAATPQAHKHDARKTPRSAANTLTGPEKKHLPKAAPKPVEATPSTADPDGEGFLKLYADLCVKRIDKLDAFRRKLLRTGVPKLQPGRARLYLSALDGGDGDAWPVSYNGKTGNFVLVLSDDDKQCMLSARRTDRVAVEQGFTDMVARTRTAVRTVAHTKGDALTLSATWTPHGTAHRLRFALTTQSAPDARVRAFGSVQLDPPPEAAPPVKRSRKLTRKPSGSPAPARRPRARP